MIKAVELRKPYPIWYIMWGYISQINSTLLLNSEHFGNEVVAREDKSSQGLENRLSLNEYESVTAVKTR
jgi:hypothetical protein